MVAKTLLFNKICLIKTTRPMRGRESDIVVEALCTLYYMYLIAWYLFEQRKEENSEVSYNFNFT